MRVGRDATLLDICVSPQLVVHVRSPEKKYKKKPTMDTIRAKDDLGKAGPAVRDADHVAVAAALAAAVEVASSTHYVVESVGLVGVE